MDMMVTVPPTIEDVGREDIVVGEVEWPSMEVELSGKVL